MATSSAGASDAILVTGIEFEGSHGYTAAERTQRRRFRCDLELRRDLAAAARTDRIQETLDYRAVCTLIVELGTTRTYRLLEAMAGAMVDAIQAKYPGVGVTLTLSKLSPPCPGTPESTAVRLTRD